MPIRPPKLKVLDDLRLDLRTWIGLRELDGEIHSVHAALAGNQCEKVLARIFGKFL